MQIVFVWNSGEHYIWNVGEKWIYMKIMFTLISCDFFYLNVLFSHEFHRDFYVNFMCEKFVLSHEFQVNRFTREDVLPVYMYLCSAKFW